MHDIGYYQSLPVDSLSLSPIERVSQFYFGEARPPKSYRAALFMTGDKHVDAGRRAHSDIEMRTAVRRIAYRRLRGKARRRRRRWRGAPIESKIGEADDDLQP